MAMTITHPDEFVETTIGPSGKKLPSDVNRIQFGSVEAKYEMLLAFRDAGRIVGGPAFEILRIGGPRHLVWLDLDTRDTDAVDAWLADTFPQAAYRRVTSTSGRRHVYLHVDQELPPSLVAGLRQALLATMPEGVRWLDRMCSARSLQPIYVPMVDGRATLPQHLFDDGQPDEAIEIEALEE